MKTSVKLTCIEGKKPKLISQDQVAVLLLPLISPFTFQLGTFSK